MSRVAKTLKNARIGLLFYSLALIANFFSRSIFLKNLGDEFMGLVATLYSILGFLNLAEMGIGAAIGFALYTPLYKKDYKEINGIISLVGFLYRKIGLAIIVLSVLTSFFFPFIFKDSTIPQTIIYFAFFSFLTSSLIGYFINYQLIVLEADQRGYVIVKYFQLSNIFRLIVQSLIAYYFQNFWIWIFLELFFALLYAFIIRWKIRKEYPWLFIKRELYTNIPAKYSTLLKKIKQTFVHKISAFVLGGTDQILIFALIDLKSVAFFGNYQLIFAQVTNLLNNLFKGTAASIGNLVAENNKLRISKVFWEMMALRYFIGGTISISILFLIEPFIKLWLGNEYILNRTILILMSCNFFISQIRVPVENFKNAYGLFSDTWAPIVEALLNLGFSFYFGNKFGISGIMLGTLISLTGIVVIWKPYYLYKHGFKINHLNYWIGNFKFILSFSICLILISYFSNNIFSSNINNFLDWFIYAAIITFLSSLIYFISLYILNQGFKDLVMRLQHLIKEIFSKYGR